MDLAHLDQLAPTVVVNQAVVSLDGVELGVVGYDDPNYQHRLHIISHANGTVQFVNGMCYDLLLALQLSLNFKYHALQGETWWGIYPNKTVFGMTGQVYNGQADISIGQASMVMMMPALKYISYLIPTSFGRLTVIFRQPRLSHDVFQSVFSYQIWVVWILVWISIAITWLIINHVWSTKLSSTTLSEDDSVEKKIRNEIPDSTMHSFTEVCLWCFSAICCKGWHNQPKEISSKTVVLIGLTFAYIISIFFSASLTSNLATETIPIKTFSDFALSNLDLYGDRRLPLVRDIVSDVYYKTRRIKQFKKGKTIDSYFMRINDSFQTILTSKSGFVTFEDAAKSESVSLKAGYSNAYFCETISAITISRTVFPTAMFVRKGSHLREVFNQKIMLLIERGIIFRLNVIYNKKTLVTCQTTEENYRGGLGLTDLSIAYIISSVGIVLCVGVLLIEKLAFGCTESKAMSWMRRHIFP